MDYYNKDNKIVDDSTPICHINEIMQDMIIEIREELFNTDLDKGKIYKLLKEIYELSQQAKYCGERMENRLRVYKEGIENLGFKRIKESHN